MLEILLVLFGALLGGFISWSVAKSFHKKAKEDTAPIHATLDDIARRVSQTRPSLIRQWTETVRKARSSIRAFSYTVDWTKDLEIHDRNDEATAWTEYIQALEQAAKGDNPDGQRTPVDIRILGPKRIDRINGLYERKKENVQMRVHPWIEKFNFRFLISDNERMILNLPSSIRADGASETGVPIRERLFITPCNDLFDARWSDDSAVEFDTYVKDEILGRLTKKKNGVAGHTEATLSQIMGVSVDVCTEYVAILLKEQRIVREHGRLYKLDTGRSGSDSSGGALLHAGQEPAETEVKDRTSQDTSGTT